MRGPECSRDRMSGRYRAACARPCGSDRRRGAPRRRGSRGTGRARSRDRRGRGRIGRGRAPLRVHAGGRGRGAAASGQGRAEERGGRGRGHASCAAWAPRSGHPGIMGQGAPYSRIAANWGISAARPSVEKTRGRGSESLPLRGTGALGAGSHRLRIVVAVDRERDQLATWSRRHGASMPRRLEDRAYARE
jgi:hypothetical protein